MVPGLLVTALVDSEVQANGVVHEDTMLICTAGTDTDWSDYVGIN